jgi:solute carrier family 45, member 1/2/4
MSLDRALYVDMLPPSQQGSVSAWAARLAGLGDVLGFLVSHASLPNHAPFSWYPSLRELSQAGKNEGQLKCLCFITSFFLLATHAVTCWAAQERRLISSEEHRRLTVGELWRTLQELVQDFAQTARNLSPPVKWVFAVQCEFTSFHLTSLPL